MQPSARHEQVESTFRELVEAAGISPPDRVDYVPASVIFYWDEPRVAVFVDFDGDEPESTGPAGVAPSRAGRDLERLLRLG
jgi:hypothetical protein